MQSENTVIQVAPSAARTATTSFTPPQEGNIPKQTYWLNQMSAGALFILDVTAGAGGGGLILRVEGFDPFGNAGAGRFDALNVAPAAVVATGVTAYNMYPSAQANAQFTQVVAGSLPMYWRVTVTADGVTSYTYSITAMLMK